MTRTIVLEKINRMPDVLMGTVADVLDKLLEGYEIGKRAEIEITFSEEELDEIDRRYEEMIAKPGASISLEEVVKYMRERHGV